MDVKRVEGVEKDFDGMWLYIPLRFDGDLEEICRSLKVRPIFGVKFMLDVGR